jgi:hypothetical protein
MRVATSPPPPRGGLVVFRAGESPRRIPSGVLRFQFVDFPWLCGYMGSVNHLLRPTVEATLVRLGGSTTLVLEHTSKTPKENEAAFNRLTHDPEAPHRVILLVNKGTEGWNWERGKSAELSVASSHEFHLSWMCSRIRTRWEPSRKRRSVPMNFSKPGGTRPEHYPGSWPLPHDGNPVPPSASAGDALQPSRATSTS